MRVYLIRHTKAQAQEQGNGRDEDRPLTPEGEETARRLGQALRARGVALDAVLTTPLLRARRTAELLVRAWGEHPPELVVCDKLAPECKPRKLARVLRELQKENVAAVGHMPDIAAWAAWLLGAKKAELHFAKGSIACVDWDSDLSKGSGVLRWLLSPGWYSESPEAEESEPLRVPAGA